MAGVLFTDLVGSTELMARVGGTAFDELRRDHFTRLRGAVAQNGGREIKTLGDGMLVVFDSASDAVACAVAMQQVVDLQARQSNAPLAIRVGLAVGEVSFEERDVFGRPVVEAARLVAQARGGQILATHAVRLVGGGRPGTSFGEVGELHLKGLPDAVLALEVGWEPLPGPSVPLPALLTDVGPIFVGREAQFAELRRAWDETAGEGLRVMLLAGEPGVGKTRMAAELATQVHAEGATVLAGRCDEDLGVPYQLFVEPLRQFIDHTPDGELPERLGRYGGELVRLVPELANRAPDLPPPLQADPETERYRVFDAVASWLGSASADRPLLLVLDDLHWAAKPNLLLLRHVLRSPGLGRLMVVGTYRDTELSHTHPLVELVADLRRGTVMDRVPLDGLTEEGVARYLAEAAGRELDEHDMAVARAIHAETQGNPFFVREVLRHLVETGAVNRRDGRWNYQLPIEDLGIPEGVREVVGRRLARLSETCNRVLRVAAVMGMEFDVPVLEVAGDLDDERVLGALEEAMAARLVKESSAEALRYRFTHSLMRETVYRDLSTARRVTLHRRVGEAIETVYAGHLDDHFPALAHHYSRAAVPVGGGAKAVAFARQAGDRALAQLAHHDAISFYQQALDLFDISDGDGEVGERLDLLVRLGEAQRRAGDPAYRETLIGACRLAQAQGDADALARAALANNRGLFAILGAVDEERAAMLQAALDAHPAETAVRARLLGNLAVEVVYGGDRDRRYALSAEALAIARRLGDPQTLAHALLQRVVAIWGPDSVVERLATTDELLALATQFDDPVLACWGCSHRFMAAMEAGDEPEADRCLERAERLADDLGQPTIRWFTMILRACRDLASGLIAKCEETAARAYALGQSAGHPDVSLYYGVLVFNVRFERGALSEIASDVIAMAAAHPGLASLRATLALLYTEIDQLDQARPVFEALVDQLGDIPREASWPRLAAQAALTCARLHDRARAEVLLGYLTPYVEQMICTGVTWSGSVAHFVGLLYGVLGRLDEADAKLTEAEAAHARVPAPTWLARTRIERARVLLARRAPGDRDRARQLLSEALATAEEYGLPRVQRAAGGLLAEMDSLVHRP